MFRCQSCQKVSQPRERAEKRVTERREKVYPLREGVQRHKGRCAAVAPVGEDEDDPFDNNPKRVRRTKLCKDDHGGVGWEIAVEKNICTACAALRPPWSAGN